MKAVPVDVMRDIAVKAQKHKVEAMKMRREARDATLIAERLEMEQHELEDLLGKWKSLFPETGDY